jgi:hypothetical protein
MSINKGYDRFGYRTPEKKVKVMEEPLAPYKKKLRKYAKTKKIKDDKKNKIIKQFWGIDKNLDLAHIPFMFKNKYLDNLNITNINYYTYVRNPYNRIISAFFINTLKVITQLLNYLSKII